MYDFLNKTTYTDELAQQENILQNLYQPKTNEIEDLDFDLVEIIQSDKEPSEEKQAQDFVEEELPEVAEDIDNTDMQFLDFLFAEKSSSSLADTNNFVTENVDLSWLKKKSDNVKFNSLNSNISKYLNSLPENLRSRLVATSGNDQKHSKNSLHYEDRAIDLRYDKKAYDFIKNDPVAKRLGINLLDPDHGTAPHIHLELKKYGGSTLFANDEETQRIGLNDPNYSQAYLNLSGVNKIRGLDNYHPVAVTDGSKYKILVGPKDTSNFKGNVYEHKL